MKVRPLLIAASLALSSSAYPEEFVINLKNPVYNAGIVSTEEGGVIEAPDLRIQAQKITYTKTKDTQNISAQGDLMMEYCGQIFVGDCLEFDLNKRTGYLVDGRTKVNVWYMGGRRLELTDDGNFKIYDGFVTTTTNKANPWKISATTATITDCEILRARNVTLKALNVPLLWVPFYKGNLNRFVDPPLRYRMLWDSGLGPRLSFRYRFHSTETFNAYARFDCRFSWEDNQIGFLGPGGSLEAEYKSSDRRSLFQTRNYGARDKTFPKENGKYHYRLQGIYKTKSEDQYSRFHLQWDKLSSKRMVGNFVDSDFEVNTRKATYLQASHYHDWAFGEITVRPLIDTFQTINQELPSSAVGLRPFELFGTGIISENYASGSHLDYTFAKQVEHLQNTKAGRIETLNSLYRPFSFFGLTSTPKAGLVGIYYSDSPDKKATNQFLFTYGGDVNFRLTKQYTSFKHLVEPSARYLGYTRPNSPVDDYYIFDIHDGYDRLDQLRFGVKQLFFSKANPIFLPAVVLDLYTYSFWGAESFSQRIPKLYADIEFNRPSYAIISNLSWNIQENVLDYGNIRWLYTVSANLAFGIEYRYRDKFYWRKAVYDNFVVDFARPLDDLLDSTLSDQRHTLLTKAHLRLTPRWNLNVQTHHGWGRPYEPNYNGARVDFYTMLTGSWLMNLTYEYLPNDPYRFSYSFKLIK